MNGQRLVIRRFVGGPLLTVCYAAAVPGHGSIIIDAPRDAWQSAIDIAESMDAPPRIAIATHGHWDHITDMSLMQQTGIPVAAHPADTGLLADPHGQGLTLPFAVDPVSIDRPIAEGDRISVGPVEFRVLHTPGHTPGSVTIWAPEADALFTGDTLLKGGAGHTAEPGASLPALSVSVRRLAAFPESTTVYAGHGAPTTIGDETWLASLDDPDAPLLQWRPTSARGSADRRR
ncbi:MAG TPA: MBL fold metallo-hydrolase [Thermomicrobiales bacterium]|nr:MBL fold metallo-hydrolase [Thermomicrobiales bacterium]